MEANYDGKGVFHFEPILKMTILLTGAFRYSDTQTEIIRSLGQTVVFMQQESSSLPFPASEFDAVVCNGLFLHHKIADFSSLKFIQLTSAGYDRVPIEEIQKRGITIKNARGVYGIPMAEWALARVLERYKHLDRFVASQNSVVWEKDRDLREINGTRVAIIGAGNIGQEVAKRLAAFGATVIGYDIVMGERPFFEEVHHISSLASEAKDYDILILTAPLTDATQHMISKQIMASMKKDAMLVNIARGGLIDTAGLVDVLSERADLFAALDVFEEEPLPEASPLWSLPNVAISPHNSFVSNGNNERMFRVIYDNLKEFLAQ